MDRSEQDMPPSKPTTGSGEPSEFLCGIMDKALSRIELDVFYRCYEATSSNDFTIF